MTAAFHADESGIVTSWLIKVVVGIALVGLVFVEGGSIIFTKLTVQDAAESAATAGVDYLSRNPQDCRGADGIARGAVANKDSEAAVTRSTCLSDGRFRVTVRKEATTMVVERIPPISDWAVAVSTATAQPASPNF
jgi:Flp pilus assembly protein TadG